MSPRTILALIMGGLVLWGIYVAVGAYCGTAQPRRRDRGAGLRGHVPGLLAAVAVDRKVATSSE